MVDLTVRIAIASATAVLTWSVSKLVRIRPGTLWFCKSDPGGTARNPADVDLDRKIGSICRGC